MIINPLPNQTPMERTLNRYLRALDLVRLRHNATVLNADYRAIGAKYAADLIVICGWAIVHCRN